MPDGTPVPFAEAIARKLNEHAIPTATGRGRRWERSVVWGNLRNPAYMGKTCFGKIGQHTDGSIRPARLARWVIDFLFWYKRVIVSLEMHMAEL